MVHTLETLHDLRLQLDEPLVRIDCLLSRGFGASESALDVWVALVHDLFVSKIN